MLPRYDLGSNMHEITQRVSAMEKGYVNPNAYFENIYIVSNLRLLYDSRTKSNSILFADPIGNIEKKALTTLITGTTDQIQIDNNLDGSITIKAPQNLSQTSTPTFSGLCLIGDLTISGNIDGVNIDGFYSNYVTHTNNSTSAHFGQDLKNTGSPTFSNLYIANNIHVLGTVDGVNISEFNSDYATHKNNSSIHFTEASIDHTHIQNIGLNTHADIDNHILNSTTAHFGQDLKSTANPTFGQLYLTDNPSAQSNATTKAYVDSLVSGVIWQEEVKEYYDPSVELPISPAIGDRYLSYATGNGWTRNDIYEWNGSIWVETEPLNNYAVFIQGGSIHPTDLFVFNGTIWCQFGTSMDHETLYNTGTNSHPQIDTHISDATIHFTKASIDHNTIQNIGTNTHGQIDTHISNNTDAHFGQNLSSTSIPTFSQLTLTSEPSDPSDVTTKNYVDEKIGEVTLQRTVISIYDPTTETPQSPIVGDRYISYATANSWVIDHIYEWDGNLWGDTIPTVGYVLYVQEGSYYSDSEVFYNGTTWIPHDSIFDHTNLKSIGTNTHTQIDNHIGDATVHFTEASINHQNITGHGTYNHESIDTHINNNTNAHFGQDLTTTANPTFASINVSAQPTLSYQVANKGYVDTIAQGLIWQSSVKEIYDATGGTPLSPNIGDRYISYVTANGWTQNYIYEWSGSEWTETIPQNGYALLVEGGTYHPNTMVLYKTTDGWIVFSTAIDHKTLLNIGTKTHDVIDSHIDDGTIHFTEASIDHDNLQNVGTNTHTQIDDHIANTTTAHFGQNLKNTGTPTFSKVYISNNPTIGSEAVRKSYIDIQKNAIIWQDSVISMFDPTAGLPVSPTEGDRYISTATAGSWIKNYIYQRLSTSWTLIQPLNGFTTFVKNVGMYVQYNLTDWVDVSSYIDHTKMINGGIYTHAIIDSHLDNSNTAHFGQDLKTSAEPTFTQVNVGTPTDGTHCANKLYVDNIVQSITNQRSVISIYDPTSGLPISPTVGDRYISSATANTWIENMIYEFTDVGWSETLPQIGIQIYVEGGTDHSHETVIYIDNTSGWVSLGTVVDHESLINKGINTHTQIDSHISNNTDAHFGQDLKVTGAPMFNLLDILSTTDATNSLTGALSVVGGASVGKNLHVNERVKTNGVTSSDVVLKGNSGNLTMLPNASMLSDISFNMPATIPLSISSLVSDASGNLSWNNQMFTSDNVKVVSMTPKLGEYSSINMAIASCSLPTDTNRYLIQIKAGKYSEGQIDIPPYVYVTGITEESVAITASGNNDLFHMSAFTALYQLSIVDVPLVAITCIDTAPYGINDSYVEISKVIVINCGVGLYAKGDTEINNVFCENFDVQGSTTAEIIMDDSNYTNFMNLFNCSSTLEDTQASSSLIMRKNAVLYANNVIFFGNEEPQYGSAITVYGGAQCILGNITIEGWINGIYAPTDTTVADIEVSSGNFFNNTSDINIVNTLTIGYFFGITDRFADVIPDECPFYLYQVYPTVINVSIKGGDFSSIKDAINAISDATVDKQYVVRVFPGTYTEDPFTTKDYVNIQGIGGSSYGIVIKSSSNGTNFITHNSESVISNVTISGDLSDVSCALVYCPGSTTVKYPSIKNCMFDNRGGINVVQNTDIGNSWLEMTNCFCSTTSDIVGHLKVLAVSPRTASNYSYGDIVQLDGTNMSIFREVTGTGASMILTNETAIYLQHIGNYIQLSDGATVAIANIRASGFNKGFYVPNTGANPTIKAEITIADTGTYDVEIKNSNTSGYFVGGMNPSKIVCDATYVSFQIRQTEKLIVTGDIYGGTNINTITNMTNAINYGTNLGNITGGSFTISGLDITISQGSGYVTQSSNTQIKYITWTEQTITIPDETNVYIYITTNGIVEYNVSLPDIHITILLGSVSTGGGAVLYQQNIANNAQYTSTATEETLRHAFGSIVSNGLIVTENATSLHLDMTSGKYYYGNRSFDASSSTNFTFYKYYRKATTGWNRDSGNIVDAYYDDGSGTLQLVSLAGFVKHAIYLTTTSSGVSTFMLVYSQETFASLAAATSGNMPNPPSSFADAIVCIAGVVVERSILGAITIGVITDVRPMISFKSGGSTATTDHNSLSNLAVGDVHTQYFRTDGVRSLAGTLQLNGNNIAGLGTISDNTTPTPNTIDIFAHKSRHNLSGDDPLDVGVPVTIGTANAEGVSNVFCRSDHVHAHGSQNGGSLHSIATTTSNGFMSSTDKTKLNNATATNTLNTLVMRDASGDFIGNSIKCESTNASTSITTGSMIINGGLGIAKNIIVGETVQILSTTDSTNTNTGSLILSGGMSIVKDAHFGNNVIVNGLINVSTLTISSTNNATDTQTGSLHVVGGVSIVKDVFIGGLLNVAGIISYDIAHILSSIDSNSTTSGSLIVAGGVGIGKNVNIGGNENLTGYFACSNTSDSTSVSTGSVRLSGGMGIQKNLNVNGMIHNFDTTQSTSITTGSVIIDGGLGVSKNTNIGGILTVRGTDDSTSSTTGTLIIDGGVGIMKSVNIGGIERIFDTTQSVSSNTGALVVYGGMGIVKNVVIGGIERILDTSQSVSTSTGSLIVSGGVGIAKSVYFNGVERIINVTDSVSTSTGSLIVNGGVGIAKTLSVSTMKPTNLTMTNNVTKISTDSTLSGNSLNNLVVEYAIKTYIDHHNHVWIIQDVEELGIPGGKANSGSWMTRTLNTISGDEADRSVIIEANRIIVASGKYFISVRAPAFCVGSHKCRLFCESDGTIVYGSSSCASESLNNQTDSNLGVLVDVSRETIYEVQHAVAHDRPDDGFGCASNLGEKEIYTEVVIIKVGSAQIH